MPSLATDTTAIHMETTGHDIDKDFRHFSSSTMSEKRGAQVGPEEFECTDPNCGVEEEMLTCDCPEYELQVGCLRGCKRWISTSNLCSPYEACCFLIDI